MALKNNPFLQQLSRGVDDFQDGIERKKNFKRQLLLRERDAERQDARREQDFQHQREAQIERSQFELLDRASRNTSLTPESRQEAFKKLTALPNLGALGFEPEVREDPKNKLFPLADDVSDKLGLPKGEQVTLDQLQDVLRTSSTLKSNAALTKQRNASARKSIAMANKALRSQKGASKDERIGELTKAMDAIRRQMTPLTNEFGIIEGQKKTFDKLKGRMEKLSNALFDEFGIETDEPDLDDKEKHRQDIEKQKQIQAVRTFLSQQGFAGDDDNLELFMQQNPDFINSKEIKSLIESMNKGQ